MTATDRLTREAIDERLRRLGLIARGAFSLEPGELDAFGLGRSWQSLVVVGNAGPALWSLLELVLATDPDPDPLDRWTRRVLDPLAQELGGQAIYPFDGPPFLPLQRWAQRAEPVFPSPIGPLIHPRFGMWHAYRAALLFRTPLEAEPASVSPAEPAESPCESCEARPCLTTCPVGAFSREGYDTEACAAHLASPDGADCMEQGCRARRACPVGQASIYPPLQARFHMEAFLAARRSS